MSLVVGEGVASALMWAPGYAHAAGCEREGAPPDPPVSRPRSVPPFAYRLVGRVPCLDVPRTHAAGGRHRHPALRLRHDRVPASGAGSPLPDRAAGGG